MHRIYTGSASRYNDITLVHCSVCAFRKESPIGPILLQVDQITSILADLTGRTLSVASFVDWYTVLYIVRLK